MTARKTVIGDDWPNLLIRISVIGSHSTSQSAIPICLFTWTNDTISMILENKVEFLNANRPPLPPRQYRRFKG